MGLLKGFAGKMIAERLKNEAIKLIDEKLNSAVIGALLPQAPEERDETDHLTIQARLNVSLENVEIFYTEHLGEDRHCSVVLPASNKELPLDSSFFLRKPEQMSASDGLELEFIELAIRSKLRGIEFNEAFMGAGVTVNAILFSAKVSGNVRSSWN